MFQMTPDEMPQAIEDDAWFGTVTLPDGRQCKGAVSGYIESGTGAFVETGLSIEWLDGTPLTGDEWNIEFSIDDRQQYLWDFVVEELFRGGVRA